MARRRDDLQAENEIVLGPEDLVALSVGLPTKGYRTVEQEKALEAEMARREQVRLADVVLFCSSPIYQAAAAKRPGYWKRFRSGAVHMPLREVLLEALEATSQVDLDAALSREEQETVRAFCQSDDVYPPNAPEW